MCFKKLPEELINYILTYSYRIQSDELLKDIRSFVYTKSVLNSKYTDKEDLLLNLIYKVQYIRPMNYKILYDRYESNYCCGLNIILSIMTIEEREYILSI